jgi:2-polyprenyl-3-methyl-5-hydroxy-6-metoxy-1,4-benzoquinol methylase
MHFRHTASNIAKRFHFALNLYNEYWRVRTTNDLLRKYGAPIMTLLDDHQYPEPSLTAPTSQLCTASQCLEPRYHYWCGEMKSPPRLGRKQWEFVFILEVLSQMQMLQPGRRGLGFGCGREPLPALMAKHGCQVVATDLATEEAMSKGWVDTNQHASNLESLNSYRICAPQIFKDSVSFQFVDMNEIPSEFSNGFDFVWSSCAFEHLGSIRHGLDFVINTMKCLKPGGVAVHTTEFNLSSNDATFEDPNCVLFRKRDMELLQDVIEAAGSKLSPLNFNVGRQPVDKHIDFPPFSASPHLKLKLGEFAATSIGLIVTKPTDLVSSGGREK